jgi:hypothetical protein
MAKPKKEKLIKLVFNNKQPKNRGSWRNLVVHRLPKKNGEFFSGIYVQSDQSPRGMTWDQFAKSSIWRVGDVIKTIRKKDGWEHYSGWHNGMLCTPACLHAYRYPWQAIFCKEGHNMGHATAALEIEGIVHEEDATKVGVKQAKVLREIPLPKMTLKTVYSLYCFTIGMLLKEYCQSSQKAVGLRPLLSSFDKWLTGQEISYSEAIEAAWRCRHIGFKYDQYCACYDARRLVKAASNPKYRCYHRAKLTNKSFTVVHPYSGPEKIFLGVWQGMPEISREWTSARMILQSMQGYSVSPVDEDGEERVARKNPTDLTDMEGRIYENRLGPVASEISRVIQLLDTSSNAYKHMEIGTGVGIAGPGRETLLRKLATEHVDLVSYKRWVELVELYFKTKSNRRAALLRNAPFGYQK